MPGILPSNPGGQHGPAWVAYEDALRQIAGHESGVWGVIAHDALTADQRAGEATLSQQPVARLAQALDTIRCRQTDLKAAAAEIEAELRRRLRQHDRTTVVLDGWEIAVESGNESVWDSDELEGVLRDLVDNGVVTAGELTGIIRRDPVVSRTDANRLAARLSGAARAAVEACRTWRQKSPGRVRVTRSVPQVTADQDERTRL
jgi:hypothetical protein